MRSAYLSSLRDPEAVAVTACAQVGLTPRSIRLLRHFANAVFLVDAETAVVARVAYKEGATGRARTAVEFTRWLASEHFPVTLPINFPGRDQPLSFSDGTTEAAVSFWAYYPQPSSTIIPADHLLGRQLHGLTPPQAIPLPVYEPLRTMRRDLSDADLDPRTIRWLQERVDLLLHQYALLDFPLGVGLIHGDLYAGNLLHSKTPPGVILGDWDSVAIGPREIDLIPTFGAARFGAPSSRLDGFASGYGYDIRRWSGFDTLRAIWELSTLTALIGLAPTRPASAHELAYRISTIRSEDTEAIWQAQ